MYHVCNECRVTQKWLPSSGLWSFRIVLANMTDSGGQLSGPLDMGDAVKGSFLEWHIFVMQRM